MPYKEKEIVKIYWSIAEAAKLVHQATSALRFWESDFYWIKVKKGKKGNRQYTRDALNQIIQINFAVNFVGMTSSGIKRAYDMGYLESIIEHVAESTRNYQDASLKRYKENYPITMEEAFSV